jgi:hypothetical protein
MLHRHFSLSHDEKLVEYRGVATPWTVGDSSEIFGGKIIPRCWAFFDGELHPTEFRFEAPGKRSSTEKYTEFPTGFVDEFSEFIFSRGLNRLLGLTDFDAVGGFPKTREVERTIGRVSVTFPVTEEQDEEQRKNSTETAWTFGCHERMDDSELMNARICWVCHKCT